MTNIQNALCVAFNLKVPAEEYRKQPSFDTSLFFAEHGNVTRKNLGASVTTASTTQPQTTATPAKWEKGKAILPSTKNVWLAEFFQGLVKRDWHVFSAHESEKDGVVTLKFMMAPRTEVEWHRTRPYEEMQAALGLACTLATYRVLGYDNPYKNPEDSREGMRAIVINGDQPNWVFQPDGSPKPNLRELVGTSLLIYTGEGLDGEIGF